MASGITKIDHERSAKIKGRRTSAIIHMVFLGLLAFPFLTTTIEETRDQQTLIVMDFTTGSSAEGANSTNQPSSNTPKSIEPKQPNRELMETTETEVLHKPTETEEAEAVEAESPTTQEVSEDDPIELEEPAEDEGNGKGAASNGANDSGNSANGNGKGFIEGSGVLTRAVIDRGNTKDLAQVDGTLVLKICINRRGLVTFAEWDKEASSIKDSKVARTALDNVLNYRFEKDQSAPSKECGRLTYIIEVS